MDPVVQSAVVSGGLTLLGVISTLIATSLFDLKKLKATQAWESNKLTRTKREKLYLSMLEVLSLFPYGNDWQIKDLDLSESEKNEKRKQRKSELLTAMEAMSKFEVSNEKELTLYASGKIHKYFRMFCAFTSVKLVESIWLNPSDKTAGIRKMKLSTRLKLKKQNLQRIKKRLVRLIRKDLKLQ